MASRLESGVAWYFWAEQTVANADVRTRLKSKRLSVFDILTITPFPETPVTSDNTCLRY